jgi:hypothetical protein
VGLVKVRHGNGVRGDQKLPGIGANLLEMEGGIVRRRREGRSSRESSTISVKISKKLPKLHAKGSFGNDVS